LVIRFGGNDERIQALKGLVKEAEATDNSELEKVLKEYEAILANDNTNVVSIPVAVGEPKADRKQPISKRRIALLRAMGRTAEASEALVQFLDFATTDAEAWIELSDLYLSQGLYAQAIYAQEEALVIAPNAWNVRCPQEEGIRCLRSEYGC
jgi:tetratricopeptide (TPR) repeat protein